MTSLVIVGRKWRDKVNGNTYHSARAWADGVLVAAAPFQYGYGEQWQWSIAAALDKAGVIHLKCLPFGTAESLGRWAERNGVKIVADCTYCTKRECKDWGRL